jgi:hypothetical protein
MSFSLLVFFLGISPYGSLFLDSLLSLGIGGGSYFFVSFLFFCCSDGGGLFLAWV